MSPDEPKTPPAEPLPGPPVDAPRREATEPTAPARSRSSERTPALDVASTLRAFPPVEDEEAELTVEALTADAFGDGSDSPAPAAFEVPTRTADPGYPRAFEPGAASLDADEFDTELTSVARVDGTKLDRAAERAEQARGQTSPGEEYYRDMVEEEISFSKATGYDKEGTAVVPLAELARREEERLRAAAPGESALAEPVEPVDRQRAIPVGEIIDVLRAARSVEEVAGVLVEIVSNLIPRVLLLWERHGRLYGFASRGMELTEVKLLTIELPKGLLQQMACAELDLESFQGPPNCGGMLDRFFDLLGGAPAEVLLLPVQVTAEDRWLLYADNRAHSLPSFELRLLEVIASRAGARADWLLDRQTIW